MTLAPNTKESAITKSPMAEITSGTMSEYEAAAREAQKAYGEASTNSLAPFLVAESIAKLRNILDDPAFKQRILSLMNTSIGFRTDKDPKVTKWDPAKNQRVAQTPYDYEIVKDCVIEALLRGLQLIGNHFNIIAGKCYITREGFEYLIRPLPFVKKFTPIIGVPVTKPNGAVINCSATWLQNSEEMSLEVQIPVKGDDRTATDDQYIGKATRKFLKRCYEMMSGNSVSDGEADGLTMVEPVSVATVTPEVQQVSSSTPSLTAGQLEQLRTSMANLLIPVGTQAFELDAAAGYGVESIELIPATAMQALMKNLSNPEYQQNWNQGLGVSGDRLVDLEDQPEPFTPPAEQQPAQAELIPAEQPRRAAPIRRQPAAQEAPENEL